jgi:DNA-binding transcriptional ArsR family regulator
LVRQKRNKRYPEGYIRNTIIELLRTNQLRFGDLRKELQISKPVLSEHLHFLLEEGSIISDKKGREIYYSLTSKAWERPDTRISLFTSTIQSYINGEITAWGSDDKKLQKLSEKKILAELARKISACILFTQIKSAETNEEWYKAGERFARDIDALIKRRIIYPEFDYKIWNEPLGQKDKLKSKIKRLYNALRKLYPEEMKVLEQVYDNPRVFKDPKTGESRWEWGLPRRSVPLKSVKLPTKQGLSKDTVVVIRKLKEPEPKMG